MIKKIIEFIKNYLKYYLVNKRKNKDIKILNDTETINLIIDKKLSFCRYGDGEFKWMMNIKQDSFQKTSAKMGKELKNIFESDNEKLLIGIPISIKSLKDNKLSAIRYWVNLYAQTNEMILKILNPKVTYGNASVTRPYMDFKKGNFNQKFANIKKLWENKKVLIAEGEYTKLGMNNDLFSKAKEVKRIICPSNNAYDYVLDIEKSIKEVASDFDICLVALGPTATILASRLSSKIQTIDIGHIDIEYEWFLRKSKTKEVIAGKYTNETKEKLIEKDLVDENYLAQIIKKIGVK